MSWSPTLYLQFNDSKQARAALEGALGMAPPQGADMTGGDRHHFVVAPIEEWITRPTVEGKAMVDPGKLRPGYWVMMKLRTSWAGYAAALAALQPYVRTLENPCNVMAGDE